MSSGGVREAIWGLIDGSRRTTAAMFSDLPMCEPCLALSEKQEKFFSELMLQPDARCVIFPVISVSGFQKIDDELGCMKCLSFEKRMSWLWKKNGRGGGTNIDAIIKTLATVAQIMPCVSSNYF